MIIHRRRARTLAIATVCLSAAAIPVTTAVGEENTATSVEPTSVRVSGQLSLTNAKFGVYRASGDLQGTWRIPPKRAVDYYKSDTAIIQKGTESFRGCLQAGQHRCGSLNSDYISWTYQRSDGQLISGGCTHAPTGGTRGFVGVRGLIMMTDTPEGEKVITRYEGQLILDAVPQEGPKRVPRGASSTTSAAGGSC